MKKMKYKSKGVRNAKTAIISIFLLILILLLIIHAYISIPPNYKDFDIIPENITYNEAGKINITHISVPEYIEYEQEFEINIYIVSYNYTNQSVFVEGKPGLSVIPICPYCESKEFFLENNKTSIVTLTFNIDEAFSSFDINGTIPTIISIFSIGNETSPNFPLCQVLFSLEVHKHSLNTYTIDILGIFIIVSFTIVYIWKSGKKSI